MKYFFNYFRIGLFVSSLLLLNKASAQTQVPLQVSATSITGSSGTADVICYAEVADTVNIAQIQVQIGNMPDSTNIVDYTFDFDQTSSLPSGYVYLRKGNNITFNVGSITDVLTLFGRVRIKDSSGNWGNYFRFISN